MYAGSDSTYAKEHEMDDNTYHMFIDIEENTGEKYTYGKCYHPFNALSVITQI